MGEIRFQDIWQDQIRAAVDIRDRYGLMAAFDYIVGEKLINYAEAARERPEFARELPKFVMSIRDLFSRQDIQCNISRFQLALRGDTEESENNDDIDGDARMGMESRLHLILDVKDLLLAEHLGTS